MLVGKEVTHEYRGRGVVTAVGGGTVTVRFGADYELDFAYPGEFMRMLRLRDYDPEVQVEIDEDVRRDRMARAEAYLREKEARHG